MQSVLTVVTPATSVDLTILANVKAELGITDSSEDVTLETYIDQASAAVTSYCNRVFARETVTQTFRNMVSRRERPDVILLDRYPVTNVATLVEDGTTLTRDTDFEVDTETGKLFRLSDDSAVNWTFDKLAVTYTAGYLLLGTLPMNIERATISLVKLLRSSATRDPSLRSENILSGLYSYTLFSPSTDFVAGLPGDVEALLAPYRNISV
jgi:hypothetical protein